MSQILRQSTQVVVRIGPFVDVGDGFTPETGVTLSGADEAEVLKAAGAATTDIAAATWAAITGADGWYNLTLTTSHTDTVGTMTVVVHDDSVCLPVFAHFQIIEEAAFDAIYAASADPKADINVGSIDANAITATSIASDAITAAKIADGAIDANTFAAGAITAAAIAADAIGASELAADAVAEIADAVWDEDATGHQTGGTFGQAIGDPVADTNTIFKAVVTDAAGATVGVDVVAVKADTAAILVDTGTDGVVVASHTTAAKAELQVEADDALVAKGLDHLVSASVAGADVTDNSIIAKLVSKSATADWDSFTNTTDALEAIRDKETDIETDTAEIGSAGAGLTVLATQTSVNTIDGIVDDILVDTAVIGAAGAGLTDLGGMSTTMKAQVEAEVDDALGGPGTGTALTAIPWNAAWDAEVQSEVQDVVDVTLPDSIVADGTRPTMAQAVYLMYLYLTERSVSGTTLTVKKVDGSTTAMTFTLSDATNPTSQTRTT